jgi:hypothetical protein
MKITRSSLRDYIRANVLWAQCAVSGRVQNKGIKVRWLQSTPRGNIRISSVRSFSLWGVILMCLKIGKEAFMIIRRLFVLHSPQPRILERIFCNRARGRNRTPHSFPRQRSLCSCSRQSGWPRGTYFHRLTRHPHMQILGGFSWKT